MLNNFYFALLGLSILLSTLTVLLALDFVLFFFTGKMILGEFEKQILRVLGRR